MAEILRRARGSNALFPSGPSGPAHAAPAVRAEIKLPLWFRWGLPIWTALVCYIEPKGREVVIENGREVMSAATGNQMALNVGRLLIVCSLAWAAYGFYRVWAQGLMHRAPTRYSVYFWGMVIGCGLVVAVHPEDIMVLLKLSGIVDAMGPGTILAAALFFLGFSAAGWQQMRGMLAPTVVVGVVFVAYGATNAVGAFRGEAMRWLLSPASVLLTLGLAVVFQPRRLQILWGISLAALVVAAVMMQNRLIFVVLLAQCGCFGFLRFRAGELRLGEVLAATAAVGATLLILSRVEIAAVSYDALRDRLFEDTRSDQFFDFFASLDWKVLLLGVGYADINATYNYGLGHVDIGYVMMAYTAGIPMSVSLIGLIVMPSLAAVKLKLHAEDAAVVSCAFGYCVLLLSSANPQFHPAFCCFCLLAGRCAGLLSEHRRNPGRIAPVIPPARRNLR